MHITVKHQMHHHAYDTEWGPLNRGGLARGYPDQKTSSQRIEISIDVPVSRAALFMQQLPLALGPENLTRLYDFRVDRPYNWRGDREDTKMDVRLVMDPRDVDNLIETTRAIRRMDGWREQWAEVIAKKMLEAA